jgi:hypothetical protein
VTDRELQLQAQLDTALERVAVLQMQIEQVAELKRAYADLADAAAQQRLRILELEQALRPFVYLIKDLDDDDISVMIEVWLDTDDIRHAARVLGGGQ